MPRLRNGLTGAVMSVPETTAAHLGSEWALVDAPVTESAEADEKKTAALTRKSGSAK